MMRAPWHLPVLVTVVTLGACTAMPTTPTDSQTRSTITPYRSDNELTNFERMEAIRVRSRMAAAQSRSTPAYGRLYDHDGKVLLELVKEGDSLITRPSTIPAELMMASLASYAPKEVSPGLPRSDGARLLLITKLGKQFDTTLSGTTVSFADTIAQDGSTDSWVGQDATNDDLDYVGDLYFASASHVDTITYSTSAVFVAKLGTGYSEVSLSGSDWAAVIGEFSDSLDANASLRMARLNTPSTLGSQAYGCVLGSASLMTVADCGWEWLVFGAKTGLAFTAAAAIPEACGGLWAPVTCPIAKRLAVAAAVAATDAAWNLWDCLHNGGSSLVDVPLMPRQEQT